MPNEGAPGGDDPTTAIETYEAEGRTVLYDAGNPLAWIESSAAVPVADFL